MQVKGFYQRKNENGEIKTTSNVIFVSTGKKTRDGKVIWRKVKKDGTLSNIFAEQFHPNTPWAFGKWFCNVDGGAIIREFPELKVKTEISEQMSHEEYCVYLSGKYYG